MCAIDAADAADAAIGTQHVLSSPEPASCGYCGFDKTNGIVRCDDCGKYFCNGPGEEFSTHIVEHLTRSQGHKKVSLHERSSFGDIRLECANCDCRNLFSLGFIHLNDQVILLCRQPCARQESLEPIQWNTEDWQPLICERQILTWLVRCPKQQERRICLKVKPRHIIELEQLWQKDSNASLADLQRKNRFEQEVEQFGDSFQDINQYVEYFRALIQMETEHSKVLSEKPIQESIAVEWKVKSKKKTFASFVLKSSDNEIDIGLGDQLLLKHLKTTWSGEGIVTKVPNLNNEKVVLRMSKTFVLTDQTDDFILERVWNYTSFNRMQVAVNKMCRQNLPMDKRIFDVIVNNRGVFEADQLQIAVKHDEDAEPTPVKHRRPINDSFVIQNPPHLPALNLSQEKAVKHALKRPLSLIQGPPGTGKTVTSATIIYNMVKSISDPKKSKVLVCAPSNVAVDHLAEKLYQTGLRVVRVYAKTQELIDSPVGFLGLHNQVKNLAEYKKFQIKHLSDLQPGKAGRARKMMDNFELKVIADAEVVCCTCIAAGDWRFDAFRFDYVLIDECTQASEPECLVPMVKGVKQLVLIGDQCQLGPVILNKQAAKDGLSRSLFERLIKLGIRPQCLQIQYRMHPLIAEFPSAQFYQNFVLNGVLASDHKLNELDAFWPIVNKPISFHSCDSREEFASSGISYLNRGEAKIVVQLLVKLMRCGLKPEQIGIITPYLGQRRYLRQYMKYCGLLKREYREGLEVSSVDAFQGREKDFIIISAVRSNEWQGVGFLRDPRRLNVALTRAKYGMIVIGNPILLRQDSYWNQLLHFFKKHDCLLEGSLDNAHFSRITLPRLRKAINQNVLPVYGSPLDEMILKLGQWNLNLSFKPNSFETLGKPMEQCEQIESVVEETDALNDQNRLEDTKFCSSLVVWNSNAYAHGQAGP